MDILGIGPLELILILIVALMVFGPDKLPTIGARLGRAMKDMRKATRAFSKEFDATRRIIEEPTKAVTEPFQDVIGLAKDVNELAIAVRNPSEAIRQSVTRAMTGSGTPAQPDDADDEKNRIAPPAAATPAGDAAESSDAPTQPRPTSPAADAEVI